MKSAWIRLSFVAGVVVVLVAGAWALGATNLKKNIIKCPQPACTTPCDTSQAVKMCSEGRSGTPFPSTYACCCCNENSKDRWFYGE